MSSAVNPTLRTLSFTLTAADPPRATAVRPDGIGSSAERPTQPDRGDDTPGGVTSGPGRAGGHSSNDPLSPGFEFPDLALEDDGEGPPAAIAEPTQPLGCSPCADGPRSGQVLAATAPYAPLPGVTIVAGSFQTHSDATGHFSLPAPSASSEFVTLAKPGRATSVIAGWYDGTLALHLSQGTEAGVPDRGMLDGGAAFFEIWGRVVAADGAPVAGALISAGSTGGAYAGATQSGPDGRFRAQIFGAQSGLAAAASVWAFERNSAGAVLRLGVQSAIDLAEVPHESGTIAPDPQDIGDIMLNEPAGQVALADGLRAPFGGFATWQVRSVTTSGVTFSYMSQAGGEPSSPVFDLPGTTTEVEAAVLGDDGHSASVWRESVVAGDVVAPQFLAAPAPTGVPTVTAGSMMIWRPIAQAESYRVELNGGDGADWEAFSSLPRLMLPVGVPTDATHLRIVASSEGPLRSVVSLPGAGARQLRYFVPPKRYATWDQTL